MYDIFFLSFSENNIQKNLTDLANRFPFVKHVHGVKGIDQAHKRCAKQTQTKFFYVVDAETEVLDTFSFGFVAPEIGTYVWRSLNPVNDLSYGWGGIKLLHKDPVLAFNQQNWVDFSTSLGCGFHPIDQIASVSHFNTSPFATWKAAFREAAKLSSRIIGNTDEKETIQRLEQWCTVGFGKPFGVYSIDGAKRGREFGKTSSLHLINDYDWLADQFSNTNLGSIDK